MGFYATDKAVFDAVKAKLKTISALKKVVLGERFKVTKLPMAIINPEETTLTPGQLGAKVMEVAVGVEILVIIRETEPADVYENIVAKLDDIIDVLLADLTLSGTVKGLRRIRRHPGELRFREKIYHGGVVGFEALLFFTPS